MPEYWDIQDNSHQVMWSLKTEYMKPHWKPGAERYCRVFIRPERGMVVNFDQNPQPANPVIPIAAWLELVTLTQEWISAHE